MVDVRYHVISLVAVFLALGIGVLLGTTLVERGLIAEQKNEIRSLKETFTEIRETNKSLKKTRDYYRDFSAQVLPYVIHDKLVGRVYAKVTSTTISDLVSNQIDSVLAEAGAVSAADITFSSFDTFKEPGVAQALAALFSMEAEPAALRERVISETVTMLASGANLEVMKRLQEIGVIQVRGDLVGPVSGVILVANKKKDEKDDEEGTLRRVDLPMMKQLATAGLPVVGVEGSRVERSVLSLYKEAGISTVENVDLPPGLTALVMVLEGRPGNYGQEKPAERIIPEMVRP